MTQEDTSQSYLGDFHVSLSQAQESDSEAVTSGGCGVSILESSQKPGRLGLLSRIVTGCSLYQSGGGVQADLEGAGYEIQCFRIPASGVGAPHVRERAVIIAHTESEPGLQTSEGTMPAGESRQTWKDVMCSAERSVNGSADNVSNTTCIGLQTEQIMLNQSEDIKRRFGCKSRGSGRYLEREFTDTDMSGDEVPKTESERNSTGFQERVRSWCGSRKACALPDWQTYPSHICRMDDGVPNKLDKPRLQALGNAVVPRVFYPFFCGIAMLEGGKF